MNGNEVRSILAYFVQAWPWLELGERTPDVWTEVLHDVPGDDAQEAAKRCVRNLDRPPSAAEFLRHCRAVQAGQRPALPAGDRGELPKRMSGRIATALAAGMRAAARDIPEHSGHTRDSAAACPACSTAHERSHAVDVMAAIREHIADGTYPEPDL